MVNVWQPSRNGDGSAMLNLITDVAGIRVGHAHDERLLSGVTAIVSSISPQSHPFACSAARRRAAISAAWSPTPPSIGSTPSCCRAAPASASMRPAASQAWLRENGRGLRGRRGSRTDRAVGDLLRSQQRRQQGLGPLSALSRARLRGRRRGQRRRLRAGQRRAAAMARAPSISRAGSARPARRHRADIPSAAIVVVNALGSALIGGGPHFWAAPLERGAEFGGLGMPPCIVPASRCTRLERRRRAAHACPAVDHDRLRRHRRQPRQGASQAPGHRRQAPASRAACACRMPPMDGDTVFAVSTGQRPLAGGMQDLIEIGALAADCLAAPSRGASTRRTCPAPAGSARRLGATASGADAPVPFESLGLAIDLPLFQPFLKQSAPH